MTVGGGDNAHVYRLVTRGTDAAKASLFQKVQQLDLNGERVIRGERSRALLA
jgi:hypothetical protein